MSQTKTPPWERVSESSIEDAIAITYNEHYQESARAAWSELQALQAVSEAAEYLLKEQCGGDFEPNGVPGLRAGLKEWRAICPRNVV